MEDKEKKLALQKAVGERVYHSLEELEEGEGYFSVVLVKEHRNET